MAGTVSSGSSAGSRVARAPLRGLAVGLRTERSLPWLTIATLLAGVELASRLGVVSADRIPPTSEIVVALGEQVQTSQFWTQLWQTISAWAIGFSAGSVAAVVLGVAIGVTPFLHRSLHLSIEFIRPITPISVLPLVVLLFGTGTQMKIYLVAFGAFFPVLVQTLYGVQDVDPLLRDTARAYGLGRIRTLVRIVLPAATPYIATGVRLAASMALILTVAAELLIGASGIGYGLNLVRYVDDMPAMYALILVTGLVGLIVALGIRWFETRVLYWHPSYRTRAGA